MNTNTELTLYHYWRSSCSWRVRWALAIKKIDYKSIAVNLLAGEQSHDDYLAINPSGAVPCLIIDGIAYGESLAIMEWLEEVFPLPPLLPVDLTERLTVRRIALMIGSGIQPLQNPMLLKQISDDASVQRAFAKRQIERSFIALETLIKKTARDYAVGNIVTFADLCLIPQIYNALRFEVNMENYPTLWRIYQSCRSLPSCQVSAPENQPGAA